MIDNNPLLDRQPDQVAFHQDPLQLNLDDETLISVINDRIKESEAWYTKENYPKRRKINRAFLLGKQRQRKLKHYESNYVDNLIYESENTIKPIALSNLPDLLVKPGSESPESRDQADRMTKVINSGVRNRQNRRVLGLAFKHVPVFFQGVIKCVWDSSIGEYGDYKYIVVHPENIICDHTATTNNPDDMDFIAEFREESVKNLIMMFPQKEEELLSHLVTKRKFNSGDEKLEKSLASKLKITEVWFTWYQKHEGEGEKKWERVEGVVWKYDTLVLGKMRNPYWDWQGEKRLFSMKMGEKKAASVEDIVISMTGGEELISETFFRNYFETPRKPYIFLGYDQLGESPLDTTSRIEQTISLQENVNKRGAMITEMNDRSKPKFIFNAKMIDKPTVENLDLNDPDQDVMVEGDVREAYGHVTSPPAPAPLYTELESERQKAFSKMGTNATTRGVREGKETATARQLFKEADFGRIDDIVEETINDAAEQMAQWALQMIKLFYTKGHMKRLLGIDGEVSFEMINQDNVEDGMEVVTSASGVDKMQLKRDAYERVKIGMTDPYNFFVDTEASDPIGRTKNLMLFMSAPELYLQQVAEGRDTAGMAEALAQQPPEGAPPPEQPPVE